MELEQITPLIESILFVSDKPVSIERFCQVLTEQSSCPTPGPSDQPATENPPNLEVAPTVETALAIIKERYAGAAYGFELREGHGGFHFCTKPASADVIRRFLQTKPFRLGRSALEVLAIIAYRQPVTRAEVDKVRGIDSSHLMRTLIERGLVKMAGKADVPGRPVQYGTTPRFLEVTGLRTLGELPPLSELEQLQGHTDDHASRMEAGLDRFVQASPTRAEVEVTGENIEGLSEIDQMIQSVSKPDREIYESETHAEIARENESAMEGFLHHLRPMRKPRKPVDDGFDSVPPEISAETVDLSEPAESSAQ